jgi:hypothetical protein
MARKPKVIVTSKANSFDGFDFKKLVISLEKPLVGLITAVITEVQVQNPALAGLAGVVGTIFYSTVKYFVKEYTA